MEPVVGSALRIDPINSRIRGYDRVAPVAHLDKAPYDVSLPAAAYMPRHAAPLVRRVGIPGRQNAQSRDLPPYLIPTGYQSSLFWYLLNSLSDMALISAILSLASLGACSLEKALSNFCA